MSQKSFDKLDKDCTEAFETYRCLLDKRRPLMEALVKDLTPRESFDMRLEQLLLEKSGWSCEGRYDCDEPVEFQESEYIIFVDHIDNDNLLDQLKDPRYNLPRSVEWSKTNNNVAKLKLTFHEDKKSS